MPAPPPPPASDASREAAEQAIHWLIELQARPEDPALRQAWRNWHQSASEHELAWSRIEALNQRLAELPAAAARSLIDGPRSPRRRKAMKSLGLFAGAGLGLVGAGLYCHGDLQRWSADYATRVGQRRRLPLDDGSVVQLNTDSAIDVDLGARQRRITLRRGEIQLQTGRDPRPLLVACAEGTLRPLGTRFTARLLPGRVRVGVTEGRVLVCNRTGKTVELPSGRQLDFDSQWLSSPAPLSSASDAWVEGLLSVNDMALDAFLAELSRYRSGRLSCDPRIARLRISGTFPLDDGQRILAMLPRVLPVRVKQFTRYWITVVPRDS